MTLVTPPKSPTLKVDVQPIEITTATHVRDFINAAESSGKVAIDTETTGLDWSLGDKAFMATFSTDIHHSWLCYNLERQVPHMLRLMEERKIKTIYHNWKFDAHMLRTASGWIPAVGYRKFDVEDTMLAFRIVAPLDSAALKVASSKYLTSADIDVDGPQKQIKAWISGHTERERRNKEWINLGIRLDEETPCFHKHEAVVIPAGTLIPPDEFNYSMIPRRLMDVYAAQDVVLTMASYDGLMRDMDELDPTGTTLRQTYNRERNLIGVLIDMETYGWPVDVNALADTAVAAKTELERSIVDLNANVGLLDGLLVSHKAPMHLNPFSAPQLAKYLYQMRGFPVPPNLTKAGKPAVDEAAITVIPDPELRDVMLRVRRWKKNFDKSRELSMYTTQERDWTYIHGDYKSDGARTGRLSSTRPALQNISRHEESRPWTHIRNVFKAAPGKSLLLADWANVEMRLFALYAQDPVLLQTFATGGDAHRAVAAMVFGKPESEVTKMERTFAKTLNFSLLYGAGVNRIYEALRYGGAGDALTEEEMRTSLSFFDASAASKLPIELGFKRLAKHLVDTYYEQFPTVKTLNKSTSGSVITRWNKYNRGFVRNLYGREVVVPRERAHIATNALIQSTSADLTKESLLRIAEALEVYSTDDVALFGTVHDEFLFEVRDGFENEVIELVRPLMCSDPIMSEYIRVQSEKNPLYQAVELTVDFAIAPHASDWAHKVSL